MAHTLPPHPLQTSCDPHLAKALAVLDALGPEGIDSLRRPMGVLVDRLGKLLCAAEAPTLPVGALLEQDLEACLQIYPALQWQEAGLRKASGVLTQVLADLGRYCIAALGSRVRILPHHACMTAAPYDRYHVVRGNAAAVHAVWGKAQGWHAAKPAT
ncbi:hypothetical protein ACSFBI_24555 [Variovorax sp. RB3P1]|uniref:hypothetical protein n=1 Tax=Variovorax sp. RB3P1 TaxID=3443732 RepID=UPI003F464F06